MFTLDRKSMIIFTYVFIIVNVVFLYSNIHFLFGNHDWYALTHRVSLNTFMNLGRWLFGVVANYSDGYILPVLNSCASFFALALSAVLYLKYVGLRLDLFSSVIVCLMIVLLPTIVGILYFQYMIFPYFVALLCSVCGLILTKGRLFVHYAGASLLICCSLAIYGNVVNSIAVIFVSGVIANLFKTDEPRFGFSYIFRLALKELVVICFGGGLYVFSVFVLRKCGYIDAGSYASTIVSLSAFWGNFLNKAPDAFLYIVYSQPFFPKYLKILLLCMCVFSLCMSCFVLVRSKSNGFARAFFAILASICLVLATRSVFFLSDKIEFAQSHFRYSYYGMAFFYAFCALILLYTSRGRINIGVKLVLCALLYLFAIQDLNAQKLWKYANDQEILFYNRLLYRIESKAGYDVNSSYTYLTLGNYASFGKVLIDRSYKYEKNSFEFIEWTSPWWGPHQGLIFLNPQLKITNAPNIHTGGYSEFDTYADFFRQNKAILDVARPWPNLNSVFIIGDVILVVMDQQYLDRARLLASQ